MKPIAYYNIFILILLISCKSKQVEPDLRQSKDSLIAEYIQLNDSNYNRILDIYDDGRKNIYYQLLKAYNQKDAYPRNFILNQVLLLKRQLSVKVDSTLEPNLKSLKLQEGYQFSYGKSFSQFGYCFTILQLKNNYSVHIQIFKQGIPNGDFNLIKEYDQQMSESQWTLITQKLDYADFWGLEPSKEQIGFDGDALTIRGIIKNSDGSQIVKSHAVNRRFVGGTAFYEPYEQLFKILAINERELK